MAKNILFVVVLLLLSAFAFGQQQSFDSIKLKPQATAPTCNASTAGTIYADSSNLLYSCNGDSFIPVTAFDSSNCTDCINADQIDETDDYAFTGKIFGAGALTCGAGTAGKAKVHTKPWQYCDNSATPTLRYAAYGSSTGVATTATALAANGSNCSAGQFPLGVDASGAAESCTALP